MQKGKFQWIFVDGVQSKSHISLKCQRHTWDSVHCITKYSLILVLQCNKLIWKMFVGYSPSWAPATAVATSWHRFLRPKKCLVSHYCLTLWKNCIFWHGRASLFRILASHNNSCYVFALSLCVTQVLHAQLWIFMSYLHVWLESEEEDDRLILMSSWSDLFIRKGLNVNSQNPTLQYIWYRASVASVASVGVGVGGGGWA